MKDLFLKTLRILARPTFGTRLWKHPLLRPIYRWYQGTYRPEFVLIDGRRLYLNYADGFFSSYVAVHGYWEKMETGLIRRYVKPGMRVLDIGANIGYYTLVMSELVGPGGKVTAFEPDTTNYELLARTVGELPEKNVELVKSAVWDHSGQIEIYINPDDLIDHRTYPAGDDRPHYAIPCTTIDEHAGGATYDFIKMDIQGAEGHALRGMARTLERKPPVAMILEIWPSALAKAGTPPEEVWNRLVELGYRMHRIDEESLSVNPITLDELLAFCDLDWKFTNLLCLQNAAG